MDDLISRQEAIDSVCKYCEYYYNENVIQDIKDLPSAQPEQHLDEWCVDCKEYDKEKHSCPRWNRVIRQTLLDAQPERKTGRWIYGESEVGNDGYYCSECGNFVPWIYEESAMNFIREYKFCPNCGAKMEGGDSE